METFRSSFACSVTSKAVLIPHDTSRHYQAFTAINSINITYHLALVDSCRTQEAVEGRAQDSNLADLEYEAEVPAVVQALEAAVQGQAHLVLQHQPLCHRTDCLGRGRSVGEVAIGWREEELLCEWTGLVRRVDRVHVVVLQCPLRTSRVVSRYLAAWN